NKTLEYIEQQERLGRLFVIRPDADLAIGKVCRKPVELERVYQIGREKGLRELERIKKYLER
ncbi:MAG: patatin family protein, partial [Lachnospiraceae bacterium]|nr:patatin family protein [Lachnospiraceae bacterium]